MMRSFKQFLGYIVLIVLFGGGFYAVNRSQDIVDWWKLRNYTPSPRIAEIVEDAQFTEEAERLFYVNDPAILSDKAEFAESCRTSREIIVLGCHVSNQKIYIYDVDDERLQGIIEVTAAHEMLHAAFDRLSLDEQERITRLLEEEYKTLQLENDRLRKTIDSYRDRDPSIVPNELHSILGTEVRNLSSPLEKYYATYFFDRGAVVSLAEEYENEFIKRDEKRASFDATLSRLKGDIARLEADISQQSQALQMERSLLESLRNDPETFNAGIPVYNSNVNAYNVTVEQLKLKIESYNEVVKQINEITVEERELIEAIDSRVEKL